MYKIVLVTDNSEFSYNLNHFLSLKHSILVNYKSIEEAIITRKRNIYNPDFIIISIDNIKNQLAYIKKIKYIFCNPKIAIILNNKEKDYFTNAIKNGANAVFDQNDRMFFNDLFFSALDQTYKVGSFINPEFCTKLFKYLYKGNQTHEIEVLTDRQNQIAHKLIGGDTYDTIAEKLGISINTVRQHIKIIYKKLNVQNRSALFKFKEVYSEKYLND